MKTKVEKAPKSPEKAEQPRRQGKLSHEDLIKAIKDAFREIKGRIDPRYLWTIDGVHRFRVNCWSEVATTHSEEEVAITHSEFVHVIETDKKLAIRRNL